MSSEFPRKMGVIWDDRVADTIPCRGCGKPVQRTAFAPKMAYCSMGCKERHTKLLPDIKRLKSVMAGWMPIYEYCPVLAWCMILPLAKAVVERKARADAEKIG